MLAWTGGALLLFFFCVRRGYPCVHPARRLCRCRHRLVRKFVSVLLMLAAVARLPLGGLRPESLDTQRLGIAVAACGRALGDLPVHSRPCVRVLLHLRAGLPTALFRNRYPAGRYAILHFALMASVVLILAAGDALTFLLSWECMSILCYLLVNYEQKQQNDSTAGFIMLAMSEAGFLAVVIAFLIAGSGASGLSFAALRAAAGQLSGEAVWGVFLLGFLGFGVKAGLVPVNFWLPRCYTAAPPAFIPVLAGVTLNLGFYGILRLNGDLVPGQGIGPGLIALVVGSITALVGILYATTENDLKTMLAHSSIENAGIIVAGFGAFLVFRNSGNAVPAAIALTAALYHMVNHSVYKALLYQGAVISKGPRARATWTAWEA